MPRPKCKNLNFFKKNQKFSKLKGVEKFFFPWNISSVLLSETSRIEGIFDLSDREVGEIEGFRAKFRQIFFRHFGGLKIGVGG